MTYDDWKTADDQPKDDKPNRTAIDDEREELYVSIARAIEIATRLRASHDAILVAAKEALHALSDLPRPHNKHADCIIHLKAAIAAAEEPSAETSARDYMDRHPYATTVMEPEEPTP